MKDNLIQSFKKKFKNKIFNRHSDYLETNEYAFSPEEIDELNKKNKKKISELKQDMFATKEYKQMNKSLSCKEESTEKEEIVEKEELAEEKECTTQEKISINEGISSQEKEIVETKLKEESAQNSSQKPSFMELSEAQQSLIMEKWNQIEQNEIDKDILYGKELLNHNYQITYADDAARFIHKIRKEYEVVISYLIGFNNEKKGIFNKITFSDKIDDEWQYLNNYIKILEKIRGTKKE